MTTVRFNCAEMLRQNDLYHYTIDLATIDSETGEVLYETSFANWFPTFKDAKDFVDKKSHAHSKGTYDEYLINRVCNEIDYEEVVSVHRFYQ